MDARHVTRTARRPFAAMSSQRGRYRHAVASDPSLPIAADFRQAGQAARGEKSLPRVRSRLLEIPARSGRIFMETRNIKVGDGDATSRLLGAVSQARRRRTKNAKEKGT